MKYRTFAALALVLSGGGWAYASPPQTRVALVTPHAWVTSVGTDGMITCLMLVFALLDDYTDAVSREITVWYQPADEPTSDAVSREVAVWYQPADGPATDAVSREVAVWYQPADGPATDAISREVTAWFDPEKEFFYTSREVSVGGTATLSGTITFGDIDPLLAPTEATVVVRDTVGNEVSSHLVTLTNGAYAIPDLPRGQFYISVKGSHWLRRSFAHTIGSDASPTLDFTLINGDVDDDNVVSVFDYIMLSDAFDSVDGDANWFAGADLDGDGVVSIFDYIILSDHFDAEGDF